MEVTEGDIEAQEQDVEFLTLTPPTQGVHLRLFPPLDLSIQAGNLFAVSNLFGWAVAAGNDGFCLYSLASIRALFASSTPHTTPDLPARLAVPTPARVVFLRFGVGDKVVLAAMLDGSVGVWRLKSLVEGNASPVHLFPSASSAPLYDLLPNPSPALPLVAVLSSSSFVIVNIETQSVASTFPASLQPTAACWSVKGKQIAVGTRAGLIGQFTPDGQPKGEVGLPPGLAGGQWEVRSLHWLENTVFLATYAKPPVPDVENHDAEVYVITTTPGGAPTFVHVFDPAPAFGLMSRLGRRWLARMKGWEPFKHLLFMANAPSMEVGAIGQSGDWAVLALPETSRPSLPLAASGDDTCPVGLELDLCSNDPVFVGAGDDRTELPPSPSLMVYTSDGVLVAWRLLNEKGGKYEGMRPPFDVITREDAATELETQPSNIQSNPSPAAGTPMAVATPPAFGAPSSSPFAVATPSAFGTPSSAFGKPAFGSTNFGSPAPVAFGASAFGSSGFATASTTAPVFGSSSTPVAFKAPTAGGFAGFGAAAATGFGAATAFPTTSPSTTGTPFGSGSKFAATTAFGGSSVSTPTFGSSGFGASTPAASTAAPNSGGFASFGAASSSGGGFAGFGTSVAAPASGFSAFSATSGSSPFAPGKPSAFASSPGTSAFGSSSASPSASAFSSTGTAKFSPFSSASVPAVQSTFSDRMGHDSDSEPEEMADDDDRKVDDPPDLEPTSTNLDISESMRSAQSSAQVVQGSKPSSASLGLGGLGGLGFGSAATTSATAAPSIFGSAAPVAVKPPVSVGFGFGSTLPAATGFGFGSPGTASTPFGSVATTSSAPAGSLPASTPTSPLSGATPTPSAFSFGPASSTVPATPAPAASVSAPAVQPPVVAPSPPSPPSESPFKVATPPAAEPLPVALPSPKPTSPPSEKPASPATQPIIPVVPPPAAETPKAASPVPVTPSPPANPKTLFGFASSPPSSPGTPSLVSRLSAQPHDGDQDEQGVQEDGDEEESEEEENTYDDEYDDENEDELEEGGDFDEDEEEPDSDHEASKVTVPPLKSDAPAPSSLLSRMSPAPVTSELASPALTTTASSFGHPSVSSSSSPFSFSSPTSTSAPVSSPFSFGAPATPTPAAAPRTTPPPQISTTPVGPPPPKALQPTFAPPPKAPAFFGAGVASTAPRTSSPLARPGFSAPPPKAAPAPTPPLPASQASPFSFATPSADSPRAVAPKPAFSFAPAVSKPVSEPAPPPSKPVSFTPPASTPPAQPRPPFSLATTSTPKVGAQLNAATVPPVKETGMSGEFLKAFQLLEEEFKLVRSNTNVCKSFIRELGQAYQLPDHAPNYDPQTWSMGDLKHLGLLTEKLKPSVSDVVDAALHQKRQVAELQSLLLKGETKREEAARFLRARSDPVFAKMVRVRQLGPEQVENQKRIRHSVEAVRSRVIQLEEHVMSLKNKVMEQRLGRSSFKTPSLDAVNRAVRNITVAITEHALELDDLSLRLDLLRVTPNSQTVTPRARRRSPSPDSFTSSILRGSPKPPTTVGLLVQPGVLATAKAALNGERSAGILKRALLSVRSTPLRNNQACAVQDNRRAISDLQLAFAAGPITGDRLPRPRRPAPAVQPTEQKFEAPATPSWALSTAPATPSWTFTNAAVSPLAPSWAATPVSGDRSPGFPVFKAPSSISFSTPVTPISSPGSGGGGSSRGGASRGSRTHSNAVQLRASPSPKTSAAASTFDWGVPPPPTLRSVGPFVSLTASPTPAPPPVPQSEADRLDQEGEDYDSEEDFEGTDDEGDGLTTVYEADEE